MLILFLLIALLSAGVVGFVGARMGVLDPGEKLKIYKSCEDDTVVPFRGLSLVLILACSLVCGFVIQLSLHENTTMLNFAKLYALYVIVVCAAVVDFKRRIIPNILIICGLIFRVVIYIAELIIVENITEVLINDLIGLAIGFGILALASFVTKGAIGFGDAKLFGVIGLLGGSFCTYSTLFMSLILSTVFSLTAIASKKMGRKDAFPFGPCIALGYIIVLLLTSY